MNLVAKEYVAAQDPQDPGVLILSKFAGAAEELTDALIVNPNDKVEVAEAIQQALHMSREERVARWQAMSKILRNSDVKRWAAAFIKDLASHKTSKARSRMVPAQKDRDDR
jgi:trehalose 6-phosphate synthase